jgi:UDP-N-acetylmuramoyl-tripeptide--D-alanyl-D-alanine ligase
MLTLADLFAAITGARPDKMENHLGDVAIQSRQIHANGIYVALPGGQTDGHALIGDAFHRGARVALVQNDVSPLFPVVDLRSGVLPEAFQAPNTPFCILVSDTRLALRKLAAFWRSKINPHFIALSGDVTDSTIGQMAAGMISPIYPVTVWQMNAEKEIDFYLTLLGITQSHQRFILDFQMDDASLIREMVDLIRPQVGLITRSGDCGGVSQAGRSGLSAAYEEFLRALPPKPDGAVVLNYDLPQERQVAGSLSAGVVFYGLNPQADLWADEVEGMGQEGIRFRLHYRNESISLRAPLLGRYSIYTALQAAAVGLVDGLSWHDIAIGLRTSSSELRLIVSRTASGALLIDDTYSASAESVLADLNLIQLMEGRKVLVVGEIPEIGEYADAHMMVGVRTSEVVQKLVTVGPDAGLVADTAIRAGMPKQAICRVSTPQEAVIWLRQTLTPQDIVLVKGSYQVFMEQIVTSLEECA